MNKESGMKNVTVSLLKQEQKGTPFQPMLATAS